jgi:hypothetical protein
MDKPLVNFCLGIYRHTILFRHITKQNRTAAHLTHAVADDIFHGLSDHSTKLCRRKQGIHRTISALDGAVLLHGAMREAAAQVTTMAHINSRPRSGRWHGMLFWSVMVLIMRRVSLGDLVMQVLHCRQRLRIRGGSDTEVQHVHQHVLPLFFVRKQRLHIVVPVLRGGIIIGAERHFR